MDAAGQSIKARPGSAPSLGPNGPNDSNDSNDSKGSGSNHSGPDVRVATARPRPASRARASAWPAPALGLEGVEVEAEHLGADPRGPSGQLAPTFERGESGGSEVKQHFHREFEVLGNGRRPGEPWR